MNATRRVDWMKGLYTFMPNAGYDLKSWGVDAERKNVCAYAVFFGTHTGEGGPCPPTGKSVRSDYVYVMSFEGDKIAHLTKIWCLEGDWLAVAAADHGRSSIQPRGLSSRFDNYVLRFHRVSTFGASRRSHQVK